MKRKQDRQEAILEAIRSAPHLTMREIAEEVGCTIGQASYSLLRLQAAGKLFRVKQWQIR